jgi:hypothetical protein
MGAHVDLKLLLLGRRHLPDIPLLHNVQHGEGNDLSQCHEHSEPEGIHHTEHATSVEWVRQ